MEVKNAHHHPAGQEEHLPGRGCSGEGREEGLVQPYREAPGRGQEEEPAGDQQEGDEGVEDVD